MTEFIAAHILCSDTDPRQAAASYLSWLAYPERDKTNKGAEFFEAVLAGTYKAQGKHPPLAFRMKREKAISTINAGLRRIARRRVPAVWMAFKAIDQDGTSIRKAAHMLCQLIDNETPDADSIPDNVRRDIWYETGPAIPMAMALVTAPQFWELNQNGRISDFLSDPGWVINSVEWAQELCAPIAKKFGLPAAFTPVLIKSPVS